jgi:hypothetical protein
VDEALKAELRARAHADQAARLGDDFSLVIKVDAENLRWLRGFIDEHGWPGADLVGEDGASAVWLLAQHAVMDVGFQRRCLDLMTEAVEAGQAGEAGRRELAYLTDQVLLGEGKPQEYGTHVTQVGRGYQPAPLRDPDSVDERRAAMGLEPLADYLRGFGG